MAGSIFNPTNAEWPPILRIGGWAAIVLS